VKKQLGAAAQQTKIRHTTPDRIKEVIVDIPPLAEQKAIGKILDSITAKIDLNYSLNHYLEAMAKQLYDYWFVQFDFPDENGKPYKSSGGKMVWNEKLKRDIPEGWSGGCFSDIANITMGQSPDGSSYNEEGNGVIFYQGSTDFGIRFPSVRMYTTAPTRFAKCGDILMSVRAPVGAVNVANADCCIGRGLSAINAKIGTITYIYFVIHYLKVRFDNLNSAGTTFGSITKDELRGLPVVVPSDDVLKLFESASKPIFDMQMNIGQEIEGLTLQRDELLPLLMNGQVSVKQLNNDL
jgi:type I restriction enzyme S subunit